MSDGRPEQTALGTARARFVEGLPRKAQELRAAVALLAATPTAERPREEMRRRLHALYASAQVFRIEPLAAALREAIQRLDEARDTGRGLSQDDLDALAALASGLESLGEAAPVRVSRLPGFPGGVSAAAATDPGAENARVRRSRTTERGMAPVTDPSPGLTPTAAPTIGVQMPPRQSVAPASRTATASLREASPVVSREDIGTTGRSAQELRPRRASGSFTAARPSERPGQTVQPVASVLVVDGVEVQTRVRAALPVDRYEMFAASDPETALRLARSTSPDVVLVDRELATRPGVDFIGRLRSDPLTDFVPVVLLWPADIPIDPVAARQLGADDLLPKPVDEAALLRVVRRLTASPEEGGAGIDDVGEVNVAELTRRLARELERGLTESVESGAELRVPMGDGVEALAAIWAAVARVRAHVAQRSGGRVRFRDVPGRGPAMMALVDDGTEPLQALEVPLTGRRIVVVDDDPAVVWFFASVLREAGAEVVEAADGQEALEAARDRRPDVVISDILMPRVDGFALCREMQRDPALAEVPVILLSWKEDFLQRMRELRAGASGYLRKEAGVAQILARVREVLRPRARLEAELRGGGEVRGRIESVGMLTLVRTVATLRPDARITARDAWNLFEVDLRGGRLVEVTRTATDGSFARGHGALVQLLGAGSGRYTVDTSHAPVRGTLRGGLDEELDRALARLRAVLDAVSGPGMSLAEAVELDDEVLDPYLKTSPGHVRSLVERIRRGEGPRALLLDGRVSARVLEAVLVDLARRGAIRAVRGPDGESRLAPPPPESMFPSSSGQLPAPLSAQRDLASADAVAVPNDRGGAEAATIESRETGRPSSVDLVALDAPFAPSELGARDESLLDPSTGEVEELDAEPLELTRTSRPPRAIAAATPSVGLRSTAPEPSSEAATKRSPDPLTQVRGAAPAATPSALEDRGAVGAPSRRTSPVEEREADEPGFVGWLVLLVVLAALGFVGYRLLVPREDRPAPAGGVPTVPFEGPASAVEPPGAAVGEPAPATGRKVELERVQTAATARAEDSPVSESSDDLAFGRVVDHIVPTDVTLRMGQGLLVVEAPSGGEQVRVEVGGRSLGNAPLHAALDEGRHEVVFVREGERRIRYLFIRAGQSRIVTPP
ncbi:MAG: response regulator [Myxococcota bacterium]|nr:response regulator [Myxococcota bacterium]MDW8363171.1 response regulator [Myxococcales bacterium]